MCLNFLALKVKDSRSLRTIARITKLFRPNFKKTLVLVKPRFKNTDLVKTL